MLCSCYQNGKNLVLICTKEFRIAAKGCVVKYRNKILSEESKAILGYLLLLISSNIFFDRKQNVEVSDETQFCKVYDSIKEGVEGF